GRVALSMERQGWPHEAVMSVIKSGLAGIDRDDADALENYLLLHRLRGASAWTMREPWTFARTITRDREEAGEVVIEQRIEAAKMDGLRRRIVDLLAPFLAALRSDEPVTLRKTVEALFKLYEDFGVRETLTRWIDEATAANLLEQGGEHQQVWEELVKMFDQMVDLLGEEKVELADFVEILDVGLEQFDLDLPPQRVDQLLVGQVERTRTTMTSLDTVFVLGLSE